MSDCVYVDKAVYPKDSGKEYTAKFYNVPKPFQELNTSAQAELNNQNGWQYKSVENIAQFSNKHVTVILTPGKVGPDLKATGDLDSSYTTVSISER